MGRMRLIHIRDPNPSLSLFTTLAATTAIPDSNACPKSYKKCPGSKLPFNFCCPSSSTCISLEDGSSLVCCPTGKNCSSIKPITCDVSLQNAALFPETVIKTTKLSDALPRCGDLLCCPFGYTCMGGNTCVITKESTTSTTISDLSTTTTSSSSMASTTSEKSTITPTTPPTTSTAPNSLPAVSCTKAEQSLSESCPSFPSKAVAAGFFPGAIFGAILVLLTLFFLRKRRSKSSSALPPSHKTGHYYNYRSSDGTVVGISDPIPSQDSPYRTDFLLRRADNNPAPSRSVLRRTGSKVKSLFSSSSFHSHNHETDDDIPPLPLTPPSQIKVRPRQNLRHQPSMESIKIYSPSAWPAPPSGAGIGLGALRVPPPRANVSRPETTFSQMIDRAGFQDSRGDPCFRVDGTPKVDKGRG